MIRRTRSGVYRFADFLELIPEDQKADLIDGEIYLASPENFDHNKLLMWLGHVVGIFVDERDLGDVTINKVAYRLADDTAPEPDLAFVRKARRGIIQWGYVDGPPDLAVEIISPSSAIRDYEDKRRRYEADGVGEYWIIDPEDKQAVFLIREGGAGPACGGFVESFPEDDVFRSRVVKGFWIDVRWLWQRPLPSALMTVQSALGGLGPSA